ncbi:pyruvate dehydrogenase (acetyl-transferring) E1 component subunit alpha [Pseudanabaena mucicola]|uniref:Pyruvate dehydrogenase E1 component subunit alpha n=1 Tax=Pseudanabaena mucicola FACHB-723 TaxID=2692860 RepID=A0ABR7ZT95_9CYAN|nr:pyruvate dehydrogenase (acetyl-transferring) E1 component subunit alpha [Pseudanabaena mucicola]MBD2186680.1 pyruvate dehydrogenase (acetyl-transferring) E1 component subunit alpha [Pseudanabaena mucicola FACHB-723]
MKSKNAVEPPVAKAPIIDPDQSQHLRDLLQQMLRIRRFEDRCAELYSAMKIRGFMHLYNGEEAVAVGVIQALKPEDAIIATYREHGQALARGVSMNAVMAEMFGKLEGCCRGRGGSMHLFDQASRFYGGNAIVASALPIAVGLALADKKMGRNQVTCCFFGDGAAAEGEFHEALNLAALWQVPILFICENNQYAMGTAIRFSHSVNNFPEKARSYGIDSQSVDGMDVLAVEAAAQKAVAAVREGVKPFFLECVTYRFRAHSMFDAELYRDKAEVEQWRQRCPIANLTQKLQAQGLLSDADLTAMQEAIDREIETAIAFAEAGTWEPVEDLTRFVYSESSDRQEVSV